MDRFARPASMGVVTAVSWLFARALRSRLAHGHMDTIRRSISTSTYNEDSDERPTNRFGGSVVSWFPFNDLPVSILTRMKYMKHDTLIENTLK